MTMGIELMETVAKIFDFITSDLCPTCTLKVADKTAQVGEVIGKEQEKRKADIKK